MCDFNDSRKLDRLLFRDFIEINRNKYESESRGFYCDWCGGITDMPTIPCKNCMLDFEKQKYEDKPMTYEDYFP